MKKNRRSKFIEIEIGIGISFKIEDRIRFIEKEISLIRWRSFNINSSVWRIRSFKINSSVWRIRSWNLKSYIKIITIRLKLKSVTNWVWLYTRKKIWKQTMILKIDL